MPLTQKPDRLNSRKLNLQETDIMQVEEKNCKNKKITIDIPKKWVASMIQQEDAIKFVLKKKLVST